jgi:hypothetical protein
MIKEKLALPFSLAILTVWSASAILAFATGQYAPLTITTPVMLMAAGYVFGVELVRKGGDK